MERILVIGSGGSGKTTVARQIAHHLELPVVHLDALYWQPGWRATEKPVWEAIVREIITSPRWVMDGNYSGTLDLRLARCDTVVFLDLPRVVCLWRVVKRWLTFRGRTRPEMTSDCPERIDWEFIRWVWTYPGRRRAGILRRLAAIRSDQRAIILSSDEEIRRFVAGLQR